MKRKHNHGLETNTYFCIVCLINSAFNRSLDNHMKAIHQDHMHLFDGDIDESLLVYSCKSCEYKFVNEQILRNHQNTSTRRHQKQEPFANFVIVNLISHHRLRSTRRSYTKKISGHLRVVTRMIDNEKRSRKRSWKGELEGGTPTKKTEEKGRGRSNG